jgi:hypothetical protein
MKLDLTALLGNEWVLLAALVVTVGLLVWVARRIRAVAKSDRPDKVLSRLAMLIGLGWSSEAVWEITGRIPQFPQHMRFLVFFVLEVVLVLSMIRADQNMREHRFPGRAGTTAWIVASVMGLVAAAVSHSLAEALLRAAIPLLLTLQWWDGLIGAGARRPDDATSWRWTPRRLLLWLGAIEPGERDVETVHRERLVQQMTRLEFRRRHGSEKQTERAARQLARLSLTADDEIVGAVRARVDRAMWFEVAQHATAEGGTDDGQGAEARREGREVPGPGEDRTGGDDQGGSGDRAGTEEGEVDPAQIEPPKSPARKRPPSSRERVLRAHQKYPHESNSSLATRLNLSPVTVKRHRPPREPEKVNGKVPDLEGVK